MTQQFNIGDRVAYSAGFCQQIGAFTGEIPRMRGVIIDLHQDGPVPRATVDWQDGRKPVRIGLGALAHVGPNLRFCAC